MIDGLSTLVVERVLLVTPQKSGSLTIPPFVRRVTIVMANNERVEADFASTPLQIQVRSHQVLGNANDWWLPAKSVKIVDHWEPDPDKIPFGQSALRTLTIEAAGTTAERLPPPPAIKDPGVVAFPGPVDRQTIVTDDGPIARAVYRWSLRPVSPKPATIQSIHIPWFDIAERRMRDAEAPSQKIAVIDSSENERPLSVPSEKSGLASTGSFVAGLASFFWTFATIYLVISREGNPARWRSLFERTPEAILQLKGAARTGDVRAFRAAVDKLSRLDRDRWRRVCEKSEVKYGLDRVNASLFSQIPASSQPLAHLGKIIISEWKNARP